MRMVLRVQELAWSLQKIRMVERSGVSGEGERERAGPEFGWCLGGGEFWGVL